MPNIIWDAKNGGIEHLLFFPRMYVFSDQNKRSTAKALYKKR